MSAGEFSHEICLSLHGNCIVGIWDHDDLLKTSNTLVDYTFDAYYWVGFEKKYYVNEHVMLAITH